MTITAEPSPEIIRQFIEQQTCWICGKGGWKALSQHLAKKHGLPAAEVREMAYMFKYERLVSEELSQAISKDALRRFGDKVWKKKVGVPDSKHILSSKTKDILGERAKVIRPLAAAAQCRRRKPHYCRVCRKLILFSKPKYCSPECSHSAWSEAARKAMTPERIERFKLIRHIPSSEEQSHRSKEYWRKFKQLPPEEQRRLALEHAASRKVRIYKNCVICNATFEVVPSHAAKKVTCGKIECKRQNQSKKSTGRKHTSESIAKMSAIAMARHEREGGRFGQTI